MGGRCERLGEARGGMTPLDMRVFVEMTPLEREMAVLRRAEMAAHKFGTAFYPYTEALGAERAARPPTSDGFCWSAGWLRPSPAEVVAPLSLEGRELEASDTEQRPEPQQGAGVRTPPSVPTSIVAAVKRQHSPRAAASASNGGLPRRPPPITAARRSRSVTLQQSAEEGVPFDEVAQATGGIEEGIPPEELVRKSAGMGAARTNPEAAAAAS